MDKIISSDYWSSMKYWLVFYFFNIRTYINALIMKYSCYQIIFRCIVNKSKISWFIYKYTKYFFHQNISLKNKSGTISRCWWTKAKASPMSYDIIVYAYLLANIPCTYILPYVLLFLITFSLFQITLSIKFRCEML